MDPGGSGLVGKWPREVWHGAGRALLGDLARAALDAVDPAGAVARALSARGDDLARARRVEVLALGKAAAGMAAAAVEAVEGARPGWTPAGMVLTKDGHGPAVPGLDFFEAAHPVPDARGVAAAEALLARARALGPDDLALVLVSGGGSALTPAPVEGVTLAELQATTDLLLASGVSIDGVNCVRRHLSRLAGGGLARALAPARVLGLLLSDVPGDRPEDIASGPLSADPTGFRDALAVLREAGLEGRVPGVVAQYLEDGEAGRVPETSKSGDPALGRVEVEVVASNRLALDAAEAAAGRAGLRVVRAGDLEGEARRAAAALADQARAAPPGTLLLAGGETTVTLGRDPGTGGRNQEVALALALAFEGRGDLTALALGTDGTDGPTDAAGGVVDGGSAARMRTAGLDPVEALARHDAYPALEAGGDLVRTGPTGTNVMDLVMILVQASAAR